MVGKISHDCLGQQMTHQEALLECGHDLVSGIRGTCHEAAPCQAIVQHWSQGLVALLTCRCLLPLNLQQTADTAMEETRSRLEVQN